MANFSLQCQNQAKQPFGTLKEQLHRMLLLKGRLNNILGVEDFKVFKSPVKIGRRWDIGKEDEIIWATKTQRHEEFSL